MLRSNMKKIIVIFMTALVLGCQSEAIYTDDNNIEAVDQKLLALTKENDRSLEFVLNDEVVSLIEEAQSLSGQRVSEDTVYHFGFNKNREVIYSGQYSIGSDGAETKHSILNPRFNEQIIYNMARSPKERLSEKLHNIYLDENDSEDEIDVYISFVQAILLPKYPIYHEEQDKYSDENNAIRIKVNRLTSIISELRYRDISQRVNRLSKMVGYTIPTDSLKGNSFLGNYIKTKIRIKDIPILLRAADVLSISEADDIPPEDPTTTNYIKDGRDTINTDQFWAPNTPTNWVGILDSGVTTNHSVLTSVVYTKRDCINGVNGDCSVDINGGTSLLDPSDGNPNDHGSSTASIIAGNNSLGNLHRGVTHLIVDSFKMSHNNSANYVAAIRAFGAAINEGDKVTLAEMQFQYGISDPLAIAADEAFDSGVAVIAVAGNYGENGAGTVACPANAHKAMAVGAFDVKTGNMLPLSGQGPTADGRTKPDFSVPSVTKAAKPHLCYTCMDDYKGTSGGGPYAAAAAGIVRSLMYQSTSQYYEPGAVYSYLMSSLDRSINSNIIGGGYLEFSDSDNTHVWWSKKTVAPNSTVTIPIYVSSSMSSITDVWASIWWPEEILQNHNKLSLYIHRPSDNHSSGCAFPTSVWQAIGWHTTDNGTWLMKVHNYGDTSQEFYYTFRAVNN